MPNLRLPERRSVKRLRRDLGQQSLRHRAPPRRACVVSIAKISPPPSPPCVATCGAPVTYYQLAAQHPTWPRPYLRTTRYLERLNTGR